ncbi:MAG: 30S ribosome-binding factor RbfA [Acidobacteriota bacterium]
MSRRTERVQDLLRAEISDLLRREVQDPRIGLTTVTGVDVSPDLSHAVVKVSVLGDDLQRDDAIAGLRHAKGFIRTQLARRMRTRVVPDLVFELDRGAEHSQRITDLLESLNDDTSS